MSCASLQFMDRTVSSRPTSAFAPSGANTDVSRLTLRRAHLPRELVCTENLTPWLKLLPCGEVHV